MIKEPRKNLKKQVKPTAFYLINLKKKITIILVMLPLKMVGVEDELGILIFLDHFLISLKIFLEKVLVVVDALEDRIIEGQI